MAATPGFKSQHQSSSAAPFPALPTIGHSCQHSGQVWPCGVEPIISKLFWIPLQMPIWGPPPGCTLLHFHSMGFGEKDLKWYSLRSSLSSSPLAPSEGGAQTTVGLCRKPIPLKFLSFTTHVVWSRPTCQQWAGGPP